MHVHRGHIFDKGTAGRCRSVFQQRECRLARKLFAELMRFDNHAVKKIVFVPLRLVEIAEFTLHALFNYRILLMMVYMGAEKNKLTKKIN